MMVRPIVNVADVEALIHLIQIILNKLLRPLLRARLRSAMRGYRQLRQCGRLDTLPLLMSDLTRQVLKQPIGKFSPRIMGAAKSYGELCLRQYLLLRVAGVNLNLSLLASLASPKSRVVHPLPIEWQDTLKAHGFKVARFKSSLLWFGYVASLMVFGIVECFSVIFAGIRYESTQLECQPYSYFVGLTEHNIPSNTVSGTGQWNIINWYLQWTGRPRLIREIRHDVLNDQVLPMMHTCGVKLLFQKKPIPPLELCAIPAYFLWVIVAVATCFVDMARGRWWHAVLLNQAAISAQVRLTKSSNLARQYLFHNSTWLYRPIWTYELPQKASECLLYFYSTNCESFARKGAKAPVPLYGYEAMHWPRYLVWDSPQADFVERVALGSFTITPVGEIWFADAPIPLPLMSGLVLALFDVTPHRASRYQSLGLGEEFYVPDVAVRLVEDVLACANILGLTVAWKRKRNVGKVAHPRYRNLAASVEARCQVKIVNSSISASALIEKSNLIISTPFTSAALLGRNAGKPSAYYDPLSMLDKEDPASHGIPILAGFSDLFAWLHCNLPAISD